MKKGKIWFSLVFLSAVLVSLLAFRQKNRETVTGEKGAFETYSRHYVMITGDGDSELWDQVYESALEEGEKRGVYVERFGKNLAVDYGRNQLLQIAIQSSVDGIIVTGDEEEETIALIDEAVDQGIPVVTVFQDSTGSRRQCFVGNNSYNIGQEYGRQILKIFGNDSDVSGSVMVLVDESKMDLSQNLILLGIRETLEKELGENHGVTVETRLVDNTRNFSSEESIRDIFLNSEEMPDILVCLNEVYTRCAYQAAVDYNKVGTVQLLGYYDSDAIVEAVAKNIIYSTITLDTDQMGRLSVRALDEYIETGYTNTYMAVDTRLIGAREAQELSSERSLED